MSEQAGGFYLGRGSDNCPPPTPPSPSILVTNTSPFEFGSELFRSDPFMFQPESLQSTQSLSAESSRVLFQLPPQALGYNMAVTSSSSSLSSESCIMPMNTSAIMGLPVELVSDIFLEFVKCQCPNLASIKTTGCIPMNSELAGLHASSSLIRIQVRKEQKIISPLLSVSKFFYRLVSGYMLRSSIYISGFQALQRLRQFQYSRYMPDSQILSRPQCWPVVIGENLFRKEGESITGANRPKIRLTRPPSIKSITEARFDPNGEGIWWNKSRREESWVPKGWEMFPSWLAGGSRHPGGHLNKEPDIDPEGIPDYDHTLSFLESAKTVILGPDKKSWDMEWRIRYVGNQHERFPDLEYASPSAYLLNKVIGSLGKTPNLEKLVVSGNALKNTFWLMPKPIGEFNPLCRLTHLTLSLPESSGSQDTPLHRLQQYIKTPNDAHICNLLTCKDTDGKPLKDFEVPFVKTLKYLHVRGSGAHVCSNLFKADWKALENVIIEMGTHRGVCNGSTEDLLHYAKLTAHDYPHMNIALTMRICDAECDRWFFGHHFWRQYVGPPVSTAQTPAEHAGTGKVFTLFRKLPGQDPPFVLHGEPVCKINFFIERETRHAMECANHLKAVDGLNVHTMIYDDDHLWMKAEGEEMLKLEISKGPLIIDEDTIENLQKKMDEEWIRSAGLSSDRCWVDLEGIF